MKTRKEAMEFAQKQLHYEYKSRPDKRAHHYGKCELQELMDFIYEGKPKEDECFTPFTNQ